MEDLRSALLVFVGGGLGAVGRWLLAGLVASPWGTVSINILGSFLLAGLMHPSAGISQSWKLGLGVGCMGGFTTYSSYNLYVFASLKDQDWSSASLQVAATLCGSLAAAALGWSLVGWARSASQAHL